MLSWCIFLSSHWLKASCFFLNSFRPMWAVLLLLCLLETYNFLQLPKFFFFVVLFFASLVRDFWIINRYSWFWKYLSIADGGGGFNFFQGTRVRIDINNISIFTRPMAIKFYKQVHLQDLTPMWLTKQVLMISSRKILL